MSCPFSWLSIQKWTHKCCIINRLPAVRAGKQRHITFICSASQGAEELHVCSGGSTETGFPFAPAAQARGLPGGIRARRLRLLRRPQPPPRRRRRPAAGPPPAHRPPAPLTPSLAARQGAPPPAHPSPARGAPARRARPAAWCRHPARRLRPALAPARPSPGRREAGGREGARKAAPARAARQSAQSPRLPPRARARHGPRMPPAAGQ